MTSPTTTSAQLVIDLWTVDPSGFDAAAASSCLALLGREERERHGRFRFPHLQRDYAIAHAAVRFALSRRARVHAADWHFATNEFGRPRVNAPVAAIGLSFNLSHTDGCIAVAVCENAEIGVDVELAVGGEDTLDIAHSHFAPPEVDALFALPPEERLERFFAYWTLKESYIKGRGMGLSLPLDAFWFDLAGEHPGIGFDARIDDDPARWQFRRLDAGPDHALALAVASGQRDFRIVRRELTPRLIAAGAGTRSSEHSGSN